jgi:hypothetical protein
MILSPLSEHRFSWDLVFIVDLVFSGIIVVPLLISLFIRRKAQWICRGSLIGIVLYILFCWIQHNQAIHLTKTFAQSLNEEILQVASLPQPFSPFRWANYVETKGKVYQGFVDLLRKEVPRPVGQKTEPFRNASFFERWRQMDGLYQPLEKIQYQSWQKLDGSPWVDKALDTDSVNFFYWFARFPVVKSVNSQNGRHRVEFMDIRFFLPGIRMPFTYYVEFDDSGKIQSEGFVERRKR